ncbi:MAG: hypothetical protein WA766_05355 [Candidatus Acidiferrales bacterium]
MKIEYPLPGFRARGPKTGVVPPEHIENARPPRVTCLLALAHRLEALVRSGEVKDHANLARVGRVSRARMSQILKLLSLAPSIQEYILSLPPRAAGKESITERDLRNIVREPRWDRQRVLFEKLVRRSG